MAGRGLTPAGQLERVAAEVAGSGGEVAPAGQSQSVVVAVEGSWSAMMGLELAAVGWAEPMMVVAGRSPDRGHTFLALQALGKEEQKLQQSHILLQSFECPHRGEGREGQTMGKSKGRVLFQVQSMSQNLSYFSLSGFSSLL